MLNYARKAWPFAFLLCLIYFYSNEIWRSSKDTHTPENPIRADHPKYEAKHDNILADAWNWTTQDPVSFYTSLLAIFTAVLGATAIVQIRYLRRADETAVISANAARDAANATVAAATASDRQAKVAEDALTQLERPYVFIFDVKEFGFDPETAEFFVEYSVANYGKMPAIIEGAYIGFEFSDRGAPPTPTLMEDSHTLMTAPILQAGEKREKIREYLPTGLTTGAIDVDVTSPNPFERTGTIGPVFDVPERNDVFFRAIIQYRGPFSRGHSTGALWLANYPAAGQLAQRGGGEYNYVR